MKKSSFSEREEEIQMMSNPERWPHSFSLPLVHRNAEGHQDSYGFLVQFSIANPCPPPKPVIYIANLFGIEKGTKLSEIPQKEYKSIEEIVDDGWKVD